MKTLYEDRIVRDPQVCGGAPIIKGTRVRVKVVLDNLAEGHTPEQIVKSYSSLTEDDVRAVIATDHKVRVRRPQK
ncbi:MAG: DUF433 domain-containing protein [Candidatus Aminicenantes bacterium]|nr:DUF433 domain-containing protein [Candidatus Aminicenantes bacterium]NIQ69086.1 DUF433 domain-containing protein [Candidatus Aminicenantes bacterium]NIR09082.1 DUF433 domain-containing protein [Candidatus Aminicenantes bacterium]